MDQGVWIGTGIGVLVGTGLGWWLAQGSLRRVLQDLERWFRETTDQTNRQGTELTARLERLRGEVQLLLGQQLREETERLQGALTEAVAAARKEQNQQLHQVLLLLDQQLEGVRRGLETRLEQFRQTQAQTVNETRRTLAVQLEALRQSTEQSLGQVREEVERRLQAIQQSVEQRLEENLKEGFSHFQKVQEHLRAAEAQLQQVHTIGQSIHELNNLLKLPHLRGQFGEAQLGRLLADFLPAYAYQEQVEIVPGSGETVDAVVRFPNYLLPIDSKFNREQVRALFETDDPARLREARRRLAQIVREQARQIARKYIRPDHGTTDLALMFLPSETLYFEVIRDGTLYEALCQMKVFPVSPNTLAITLRTIAMSLGYYEMARNVRQTLEQIQKAQHRLTQFQARFQDIGNGLMKAQRAYEIAAGHLNRYLTQIQRFNLEGSLGLSEPVDQKQGTFPSVPSSEKEEGQ